MTEQEMAANLEQARKRSVTCCWCLAPCDDLAGLKAHSASCPTHPLMAEVKRLQGIIDSLAARCAAQSDVLTRQAERAEVRDG